MTCSTKLGQSGLQVSWIGLADTIAGSQKRFQSNVDSNWRERTGDWYVWQFTREASVPLVSFAFQRYCFDDAFDPTMQVHTDLADMLDIEAVASETDTIAVSGECDAIETVTGLESWVTNLGSTFLDAAEEVLKRLVESAHRCLGGRNIDSRKEGIDETLFSEPSTLLGIFD